ncbi:hypothetical protein ES703_50209 [subsurface metagenome]
MAFISSQCFQTKIPIVAIKVVTAPVTKPTGPNKTPKPAIKVGNNPINVKIGPTIKARPAANIVILVINSLVSGDRSVNIFKSSDNLSTANPITGINAFPKASFASSISLGKEVNFFPTSPIAFS